MNRDADHRISSTPKHLTQQAQKRKESGTDETR